ncbi:hypothetical protein BBP40_004122 [Aspergillus hancockii]|nr:hypothetical protein BBP40_004122 [Aspergillus hancockii]
MALGKLPAQQSKLVYRTKPPANNDRQGEPSQTASAKLVPSKAPQTKNPVSQNAGSEELSSQNAGSGGQGQTSQHQNNQNQGGHSRGGQTQESPSHENEPRKMTSFYADWLRENDLDTNTDVRTLGDQLFGKFKAAAHAYADEYERKSGRQLQDDMDILKR